MLLKLTALICKYAIKKEYIIYQQYVVFKGSCGVRVKTIINILQRNHINVSMKFSNKSIASKSNLAFNILNCKKRAERTLTGPKSTEFSEAYFQTCQTSMLDHFCETFSI